MSGTTHLPGFDGAQPVLITHTCALLHGEHILEAVHPLRLRNKLASPLLPVICLRCLALLLFASYPHASTCAPQHHRTRLTPNASMEASHFFNASGSSSADASNARPLSSSCPSRPWAKIRYPSEHKIDQNERCTYPKMVPLALTHSQLATASKATTQRTHILALMHQRRCCSWSRCNSPGP